MALITLLDAQLAFGHVALLDHAGFSLETAERVGLIGRNGAGKSSLLRILGGLEKPDDGDLLITIVVQVGSAFFQDDITNGQNDKPQRCHHQRLAGITFQG